MSPDLLDELLCLITALRHVLEDSRPLDREELESRLELQGAKPVTISTLLRMEEGLGP